MIQRTSKNSEIWFEKDIENFIGKTRYIFSKEYKKVIKNKLDSVI